MEWLKLGRGCDGYLESSLRIPPPLHLHAFGQVFSNLQAILSPSIPTCNQQSSVSSTHSPEILSCRIYERQHTITRRASPCTASRIAYPPFFKQRTYSSNTCQATWYLTYTILLHQPFFTLHTPHPQSPPSSPPTSPREKSKRIPRQSHHGSSNPTTPGTAV